MTGVKEIEGVVFEGASAVLLARVTHTDGSPIVPGEISTVVYTVRERSGCDGQTQGVTGHMSVSLTPADVLLSTLQTSGEWSVDAIGFNFRHEIDVLTNLAFPVAGRGYEVRYVLTPYVGQPVVMRFLVRAL
ncbi:hypothetical protein [Botrimarina hoheduenensis]|uniref:Uncharacterized protein n=1 Tax=Botrimarina hoheduenensis TaxID=2528000 RepID=A0A5C5W8Z9_9BACT|nr:hypothetical protein [Botrimarina hoheduenensis]TWT46491.1 hypothetical protein Pla111_15870 [Botrimarina hoheduenensis]